MIKRVAAPALALIVAACSTEKATGPAVPLNGIFVLRSVSGAALPAQANLQGTTILEIIADTIWIDHEGFATQKTVSSSAAASGPYVNSRTLQVWDKGGENFDAEYPCPDNAFSSTLSCIAPPHHKGVRTSTGMRLNYSVIYRTPMVYERVGELTAVR